MNNNNVEKKKGLKSRDTLFIILMLAYPVLQFAVFFIYVNLNTIKMSFEYLNYSTGKIEFNGYYYRMFFYELVNMEQMKIGLKNSLFAMLNNIFVIMPLGVICGYFFYKKVPCSAIFKVIFFIPNIISIVVLSMVYKYMFDPTLGPIAEIMRNFGWEVIPDFFNDPKFAFPLILLYCNWAGIGYNTLVLSGNINKIPKELIEYGQLEGLGLLKEIWLIVVPCIWPIISTMIVTGSMAVFTFFIQVQIFTAGNADTATIAFIINGLVAGGSQNLEKAAAFGICCTLFAAPMLIGIKKLTGMIYQDVEF